MYDEDFALVADLAFGNEGTSIINDVVVTKTAAFFTDSFQPHIYKVQGVGSVNHSPSEKI